jgi:hypothetical protein
MPEKKQLKSCDKDVMVRDAADLRKKGMCSISAKKC